jgi:addiction module RelE/StbE family toxin
MDISYSEKAVKQIKRIHRGDRKSAEIIIKTIEAFSLEPSGNFDIKTLKGKYEDLKRLRIRSYRVIFEVIENVIFIYEIKHRQEAYHD